MRVPRHPTLIRQQLVARRKQPASSSPMLAASLVSCAHRCGRAACRCHPGGEVSPQQSRYFEQLGALHGYLRERCAGGASRIVASYDEPIGRRFGRTRAAALPLPA